MDAPNPSATPAFATRTPLHIGAVGLAVRDLDRTAAYYCDVIGLKPIERTDGVAKLGVDSVVLLELSQQPELPRDDPRTAGLYHTAFLMPTRADLARWVLHISRTRTPITGASDHGVSEAFYLDDPEGNGIEVYADRAREAWQWSDGLVSMPTKPLDVEDILAELGRTGVNAAAAADYSAPDGLRIGHIHLRVGDLDAAEGFYRGALGLDLTRRRQGAAFMSTGHYHHHVAGNVWHSAGATRRDPRAGLAWFSMLAADAPTFEAARARLAAAGARVSPAPDGIETEDPWGTRIRLQQS